MDAIYQFLIVVLTAIVLQNAVFTRGALVNLQHVPYNFANLPHLENVNR